MSVGRVASFALAGCLAAGCGAAPATAVGPNGSVEGLTYSRFVGSTLSLRLQAGQVLFLPRRFGIFEVPSLGDVVLTHVRIELFERSRSAGPPDEPGGAARPLLLAPGGFTGSRRVSGATVYDLDCLIVRDGRPFARILAARGRADAPGRDIALRDVRIEHLSTARTFTARRAVWRTDAGELVIRGEYALDAGGDVSTGRGIRLEVDADLAPAAL